MRFLWFTSCVLLWRQLNFLCCYSFHSCVLKFTRTFIISTESLWSSSWFLYRILSLVFLWGILCVCLQWLHCGMDKQITAACWLLNVRRVVHVCGVVTKQSVEPDNLKLHWNNNILSVQGAMFIWSSFENICVRGCDIM